MLQTLFHIPSWIFDGWLLAAWLVGGLIIMAVMIARHGWSKDVLGFIPVYLLVAAAIYWVLPMMQVTGLDAEGNTIPQGLAIRGYGLMLLLGLVAGVSLALLRARQVGVPPDRIFSLAICLLISGMIGARLFYVVQKFEQFQTGSPGEMLIAIVDLTKGGLVVYGSLVGAVVGSAIFFWRTKAPVWATADIVAPAMVLGLAIGRIGCLMNGCCFGGPCAAPPGLSFPAGSPPYLRQLENGSILGLTTHLEKSSDPQAEPGGRSAAGGALGCSWFAPAPQVLVVDQVAAGSLAAQHGVRVGERIQVNIGSDLAIRAVKEDDIPLRAEIVLYSDSAAPRRIPIAALPDYSVPVHPTQIYSAINAALLCAVLWFYYPYRRFDGEVFAWGLVLYSFTRFLLELVRVDESGLFGTPLTISQWISLITLAIALGLLFRWYCRLARRPQVARTA